MTEEEIDKEIDEELLPELLQQYQKHKDACRKMQEADLAIKEKKKRLLALLLEKFRP